MLDEDERGSWHHRGARTWHHMLPAGIDLLDSRNIRKVSDPRDEPILDANIAHKRWAAVAIHDNAVSNHQIHAGHQVLAQGVHACQWCAWTLDRREGRHRTCPAVASAVTTYVLIVWVKKKGKNSNLFKTARNRNQAAARGPGPWNNLCVARCRPRTHLFSSALEALLAALEPPVFRTLGIDVKGIDWRIGLGEKRRVAVVVRPRKKPKVRPYHTADSVLAETAIPERKSSNKIDLSQDPTARLQKMLKKSKGT